MGLRCVMRAIKKNKLAIRRNKEFFDALIQYCIKTEDVDGIIQLLKSTDLNDPITIFQIVLDIENAFKPEKGTMLYSEIDWIIGVYAAGIIDVFRNAPICDWVKFLTNTGLATERLMVIIMDRLHLPDQKKMALKHPEVVTYLHEKGMLIHLREYYKFIYDFHPIEIVPDYVIDALYEPGFGELWEKNVKLLEELNNRLGT